MKRKEKRVLLGATHSVIEPLGLLHLSSIARQEGWDARIALGKERDFSDFERVLRDYKPDLVGFTVYTGNHTNVFSYLDRLRNRDNVPVIVGGPHATYFPGDSAKHADYVSVSEGFESFRSVLRGEADKGILHLRTRGEFPIPDREQFYRDHPDHGKSPIKSVITKTGCPYKCTYCYNSSLLDDISGDLGGEQVREMAKVLGRSRRLFLVANRPVDDIVREVEEIMEVSPETQRIYFQDDVFGAGENWLREFTSKFSDLGVPFHAQMRFEYADPKSSAKKRRMEMIREAGCDGLTFAIESASGEIRRDVLNRDMEEDLMFRVFHNLNELGYRIRTEQMLGLPYGATQNPTPVNIEADLDTLALNVRLKEETGLPTMAWASIFAPYRGTAIGRYCEDHGFYCGGDSDVPETFFERSVLRFPKEWVGPSLSLHDNGSWLDGEGLEKYRDRLQMLRDLFSIFALTPKGDVLAQKFLSDRDQSFMGLSTTTRRHLYDEVLYGINNGNPEEDTSNTK